MSSNRLLNQIKGSLIGGAAGDALGYPVEFLQASEIFSRYGEKGITKYALYEGTARISDDTQMLLFTANGLLVAETKKSADPTREVANAYLDWYHTQITSSSDWDSVLPKSTGTIPTRDPKNPNISWLLDVPELYHRRAPGNTCMSALHHFKKTEEFGTPEYAINNSKGCGGIMRTAPAAFFSENLSIEESDALAAKLAAITHSHPLGFLPSAVLNHILVRILHPSEPSMTLEEIVSEAPETVAALHLMPYDVQMEALRNLIHLAMKLAENNASDLDNIHRLGGGWVADEALAIAIYCSLRYRTNFSAGLIASVNHSGDSDSTGAITGNILGALVGYDKIEEKWKQNLELSDVISEIAEDLFLGYPAETDERILAWKQKYIEMHRLQT